VKPCRLYIDEDASDADLVTALRSRHVDVITTWDAGLREATDETQIQWAAEQQCVLYTFNAKHFYALHRLILSRGETHAGIIIAPQQRYSVGEQMRRLLRLLAARTPADMRNHVEFLSHWDPPV
jgi:hypothetical protein